MTAIPEGFMRVETYDRNDDGSVTVYAHDSNGDPIVQTFPAGTELTILKPPTREQRIEAHYRAMVAGCFPAPSPVQSAIAAALAHRLVEIEDEQRGES